MKKKVTSVSITLCLVFASVISAYAGGALEQIDVTGNIPSPVPTHIIGKLVGIKWDVRSLPIKYTMNTSQNPVPNPLGAPVLTVAQAQTALQVSFDAWNNLPTSYIDMRITGTTSKTSLVGFDFINELTFRTATGFAAIASSPSTTLIRDTTFVNGMKLDNDSDPDVSDAISVCTDVDNDGDLEFPAGFYKAGTILDNDVQFNTKTTNGFRFTTGTAALDNVTRSVDINTVATHEFGHSHGLSHSFDNQINRDSGTGATMFPFIDTGDPVDELNQASLSTDDIAYSSFFYPEGTASTGPAALQPGDIAFNQAFGLIKGELRHGVLKQPIAGGSVFAVNWDTGDVVASAYSGTTQLSVAPNGSLNLIDPGFNIPDGRYTIPVPKGSYAVGVEPVDGSPAAATNISLTCQIGSIFGQQNFNEEFWNNRKEDSVELRLGQRKQISIQAGRTQLGINITTANSINLNNFGSRDFVGFSNSPAGRLYAVQIPGSQIAAINPGQDLNIQGIAFDTIVTDASVAPVFAQAVLTTGVVNGNTATIDMANPLQLATGFLGQDGDFAPFYFSEPQDLGRVVRSGIANGTIQNLFIVLQIPTSTPYQGISNQAPFIGLDGGVATNDSPIFGQSFLSTNGGPFTKNATFNFRFSLILSQPVTPTGQQ
jgi:hypothetical protein